MSELMQEVVIDEKPKKNLYKKLPDDMASRPKDWNKFPENGAVMWVFVRIHDAAMNFLDRTYGSIAFQKDKR